MCFANDLVRNQWRVFPEPFELYDDKCISAVTRLMSRKQKDTPVLSYSKQIYTKLISDEIGFAMRGVNKKGEETFWINSFAGNRDALTRAISKNKYPEQVEAVKLFLAEVDEKCPTPAKPTPSLIKAAL